MPAPPLRKPLRDQRLAYVPPIDPDESKLTAEAVAIPAAVAREHHGVGGGHDLTKPGLRRDRQSFFRLAPRARRQFRCVDVEDSNVLAVRHLYGVTIDHAGDPRFADDFARRLVL